MRLKMSMPGKCRPSAVVLLWYYEVSMGAAGALALGGGAGDRPQLAAQPTSQPSKRACELPLLLLALAKLECCTHTPSTCLHTHYSGKGKKILQVCN